MAIEPFIRDSIDRLGYLYVDDLMKEVLSAYPTSYYQRQNSIGADGDFTTAPEISQLFGEIIALWAISTWQTMGCPEQTGLVEIGPGQGSLMRDFLRVAKLVPAFYNSLNLQMIDINLSLIDKQKRNLALSDLEITWLNKIERILPLPSIIIANEFFDALPIKQYTKINQIWREVVVTVNRENGALQFGHMPIDNFLQNELLLTHPNAIDGAILERSQVSEEIMDFIVMHLSKYRGASLIIDYGYDFDPATRQSNQYSPTLQAVKAHKYHPIFMNLGEADLSAHVDFHALKNCAARESIIKYSFTDQGNFLVQNGILIRSSLLKKNLPPAAKRIINKQITRLLASDQMGELFKVLILQA